MPTKIFTRAFLQNFMCYYFNAGVRSNHVADLTDKESFTFVQVTSWDRPVVFTDLSEPLVICRIPIDILIRHLTKEALFVVGLNLNVLRCTHA